MDFKYVRIQGRELSYVTKQPKGIFAMCWRMIYDNRVAKEEEARFREIDEWFKQNLPEPEVCKSGDAAVITYFKVPTTGHMLEKLIPAMQMLDKYNHPYDVVYTNFVGDIMYEDEYQVAVDAQVRL